MTSPMHPHADRPARCDGFTMIEVVMSLIVVAVLLAAVLNAVGASRTSLSTVADRAHATALAEQMCSEILAHAYRDPTAPQTFGPTHNETTGDRSAFDDVDDYHQWSASPPEAPDGTPLENVEHLRRSVTVTPVDSAGLTEADEDTGIKRVTVTVSRRGIPLARRVAFRTNALPTGQP